MLIDYRPSSDYSIRFGYIRLWSTVLSVRSGKSDILRIGEISLTWGESLSQLVVQYVFSIVVHWQTNSTKMKKTLITMCHAPSGICASLICTLISNLRKAISKFRNFFVSQRLSSIFFWCSLFWFYDLSKIHFLLCQTSGLSGTWQKTGFEVGNVSHRGRAKIIFEKWPLNWWKAIAGF